MPALFSSPPKIPPPPPPPPVVQDTSVQDAKVAAAQRRNKAMGYQSTILSTMAQQGAATGPGTKTTFGS